MNPYSSPLGPVPKPFFSGVPLWMKRFLAVSLIIAAVLSVISFCLVMRWGVTSLANGTVMGDFVWKIRDLFDF